MALRATGKDEVGPLTKWVGKRSREEGELRQDGLGWIEPSKKREERTTIDKLSSNSSSAARKEIVMTVVMFFCRLSFVRDFAV